MTPPRHRADERTRRREIEIPVGPSAPFRGRDDEWKPPCQDPANQRYPDQFVDPANPSDVQAAIAVCRSQCERRLECYSGGRTRRETGIWGGHLLIDGVVTQKFTRSRWGEGNRREARGA